MLKIYNNYSLKNRNAFKFSIKTRYFATFSKSQDLNKLIKLFNLQKFKHITLGRGFNTLFTRDFDGLIINPNIRGVTKVKESRNSILLKLGAGEDWIKLVKWSVKNNYSGIENLALIPGNVGSAPVQNIAAYGQNFEDVFVKLKAFDINTNKYIWFNKKNCKFGYRDSFFKHSKGRFIILEVIIKLSKTKHLETSYHSRYESLAGEIAKYSKPPYKINDIYNAVCRIRRRKFPNWNTTGTAGSFFLNPVVTKKKLAVLQKTYPSIQYYPINKLSYPTPENPNFVHEDYVKIAAGWLLEELGWKGKRIGNFGTSPNQSLVVVNYGNNSTASELINFTNKIKSDFKKAFQITLEPEVNII